MTTIPISLRVFTNRSKLLLALSAAWLLAAPAGALPVVFDAPSGYGISSTSANAAVAAGFAQLTPAQLSQGSAFGITIPDPAVLSASISGSPSSTSPSTATSRWTVQNGGRAVLDPWLVFLNPLTNPTAYTRSLVGIDLQAGGQWGIVQITQGSTQYFYPAVRLGHLVPNGSAQFVMNHVIGMALNQQGGNYVLPRYGVAFLGTVPGPAALSLLGMLFTGLALRRRSIA